MSKQKPLSSMNFLNEIGKALLYEIASKINKKMQTFVVDTMGFDIKEFNKLKNNKLYYINMPYGLALFKRKGDAWKCMKVISAIYSLIEINGQGKKLENTYRIMEYIPERLKKYETTIGFVQMQGYLTGGKLKQLAKGLRRCMGIYMSPKLEKPQVLENLALSWSM